MNIACPPKRSAPEGARLQCFSSLYEAKLFLVEILLSEEVQLSRPAPMLSARGRHG
jgi:hypothetical protein